MGNNYLPYAKQNITEKDIKSVLNVLRSDFITQGPVIKQFENALSKKVCSNYVVAHNSATSALHTACLALELGPGDILWTTPITFVASANCGRYCGSSVDFVDIDPKTGLISIDSLKNKLESSEKKGTLPKILVVVHLGGTSCDMENIYNLSKKYGFSIIEDASHALGGKYLGQPVGNCKFSQITIFSFHPVKIITSAEGGAACTNNEILAAKMRSYVSHGIVREKDKFILSKTNPWSYEQQDLGFNYRLSDLHAALGLSQLDRLDDIVNERNKLLIVYKQLFSESGLEFLHIPQNVSSSVHLAVLKVCNNDKALHQKLFSYLRKKNIGVQLHYSPIHLQPYYRNLGFKEGDFHYAEEYAYSSISIPLFPGLQKEDQKRVSNLIIEKIT